ncbi:MATE family efflux transporter [Litoreibacter arenae]|uniref:Multi antimicrobial extrusion protein (Na(+)/drug antiporter) n=1 Tax=Litoreibacter arenae DSM 19593 TaxID=1123360 RepID=S9RFY4_9RHOB|nr:MATE family efflux transporter [Litoreibacter arenae]EPX77000.1 Multi antimicrobial extrusion protein (Na(+)/drug antiporter) [Litoreibacter arenae DSM 19593]
MRDIDLTEGLISSHFRTLAVPAALGMLFSTLYNVVDVYFAGQISTQAQAGLAIGFQAFFIMMSVGFGLGAAMSALVGNARGKKDDAAASKLASQGISFGLAAVVLLMAGAMFAGPSLIALVSEPGAYRDAATNYFYWLIFALPAFLLAYGANGILQAHGDTVSMQRAMMVAFLANVGLNPLLIYGIPGLLPGMGLNGIALATIISQTGVMVWILYQVMGRRIMEDFNLTWLKPNLASYAEITAQMLPTTTAMMVMFVSGFVVQFALKGFGPEAIAAYGVALRVEQILLLPVLGMTGALLPIAAQNYGAGQFDRVRDALFTCWKLGFVMTFAAFPILWFASPTVVALFNDDPEVVRIGVSYLRIDGFIFPVYMMLFAINSFLQALKRPIWTLWISIYRQGFGVAFFIWVYVGVFGIGVWGVWIGIATAVVSGWLIAIVVTKRIADQKIGGLSPS